ncbi:hypothetical protein DTL21_05880 [Bremerella cremea]|uniref:Uncharacterized protein n=1 Tax=Blastopirellula marina TaxID=124 RepID=A0A2S8FZH5_9BACT|nr:MULTISPECIES: hypothetical protein [Pirellulaceae]PQO37470.1 hypothetical protein C5Y83_05880 [Blastopirellula marina]RCS49857.1 hypothetical protein DTL21_05880 [Bremerella cremea]
MVVATRFHVRITDRKSGEIRHEDLNAESAEEVFAHFDARQFDVAIVRQEPYDEAKIQQEEAEKHFPGNLRRWITDPKRARDAKRFGIAVLYVVCLYSAVAFVVFSRPLLQINFPVSYTVGLIVLIGCVANIVLYQIAKYLRDDQPDE